MTPTQVWAGRRSAGRVVLEVRQIDPRHHDVLETEIEPGRHRPQVFHRGAKPWLTIW